MTVEVTIENEPFYKKAESTKFTSPLSEDTSDLLLKLFMVDADCKKTGNKGPTIEECRKDAMCDLIMKRIDAFKLPLNFTPTGLLALTFLTEGRPGKAVVGLVDILTKFEGKDEITMSDIYDLYPNGMYNEKTFEDYIDNYLKPNKVKWAEIY